MNGRRWTPSSSVYGLLRHRWVLITGAVLAAGLMVLPSQPLDSPPSSKAKTTSGSPGSSNVTGFLPYLISTSSFPAAANVLNATGGATFPQLATTEEGNQSLYELAFVNTSTTRANSFVYSSGIYNASLAQQEATGLGCSGSCARQPIAWGSPTTLALFGLKNVTGDAIAVSGSMVAAAAASAGYTSVFLSSLYGSNGTWENETASGRLSGGSPRLSLQPCGLIATTVTSTNLEATTFSIPCHYIPQGISGGGIGHNSQTYLPTVGGLSPSGGPYGLTVQIFGKHFWSGASATFGGTAATTTYISPTHLLAIAPSGFSAGTQVNVAVSVNGTTSPQDCASEFTYSNSIQGEVNESWPGIGPPGAQVYINGSNLYSGGTLPTVYFGRASATIVDPTPSQFIVLAPPGNGTVYIQVENSTSVTPTTCNAQFTYNPGVPPARSVALPLADAAYPAWVPGPAFNETPAVLASNVSNSEITYYNSTTGGRTFHATKVAAFNNSLGSQIFGQIGGTRLAMSQGTGGQVSVVAEGAYVFGIFTSRVQGRNAIETVSSSNDGRNWTGPYLAASYQGAASDPVVTSSRAGYVYASWRDDALGPWEVDAAAYSFTGQALQAPTPIPKSGPLVGGGAGPPALTVDGLERSLYLWSAWNNTSNQFELQSTGGLLAPLAALQTLRSEWNETVPSDFKPMSAMALSTFRSSVNTTLVQLQTDLHSLRTASGECAAENYLFQSVYPLVTSPPLAPLTAGLAPSGCTLSNPGSGASDLAAVQGPYAANSYLYVMASWIAESLGRGTMFDPSWVGSPLGGEVSIYPNEGSPPIIYPLATPVSKGDPQGDFLTVDPVTINPNTLWLNASSWFPSDSLPATALDKVNNAWQFCSWTTYSVHVSRVNLSLTEIPVGGSRSSSTYVNNWELASVYVTNLSTNETGVWWENVSISFSRTFGPTSGCIGPLEYSVKGSTSTWPQNAALNLSGRFTTGLSFSPWSSSLPLIVQSVQDGPNKAIDSMFWNNTILSEAWVWNNMTSSPHNYSSPRNNTTLLTAEKFRFSPQPLSATYQAYAQINTTHGGYTNAWRTVLNADQTTNYAGDLKDTASCSYTQGVNLVEIHGAQVTNFTDTSVSISWFSKSSGVGWVDYNNSADENYSAGATRANVGGTWPYEYQAELHGLSPWGVYEANVGVGAFSGCLEYENSTFLSFQSTTQAQLFEYDYPYDSITHQGGGAAVEWQEPYGFSSKAVWKNGTATYFPTNNATDVTSIPIQSPWNISVDRGAGTTVGFNMSALTPNTSYNVSLALNFTARGQAFHAGSKPFVFLYGRDTSGDGLTDWEKLRGWQVTYQGTTGIWYAQHVTANPILISTNGLVSDYEEKEFGLNPGTVDTAGSHMLDTWNLTFDLGSKYSPLSVPSGGNFEFWNESGNYTWTNACQYFVLPGSSCTKGALNMGTWSNLTGNDSWEWASRVLWSRIALERFVNLSGVRNASWLRAVIGNTSTNWTLTVWGKLSWGANPLAASTPLNGVQDGARVNPLYGTALMISSLNATIAPGNSSLCQGYLPGSGSFGWAVNFSLNWSTVTGPRENGNFSSSTQDQGYDGFIYRCGDVSDYQVEIPINGTSQYLSLQARILLNTQQNASRTPQLASLVFTKSAGVGAGRVSISYNTLLGRKTKYAYSDSSNGAGSLSFNLSTVTVGTRDPTFVWLPTDNSTMNNLPWGLRRYTGEEAFALIVVNQVEDSSLTSDPIPYAQNSSVDYELTLAPGLNDFLIPRGQFLSSVMGQAILLDKNTSWKNSSARPPLLDTAENRSISFGGSNPLWNLGCYWQNRSIANGTGSPKPMCNGTLYTAEQGTPLRSNDSIVLGAATSLSGMNAGGVPTDPTLENSSDAGAALQTLLTLNITGSTELDLLLAGLVDNASGGLNGSFLSIAPQVPMLGFNPVLLNALANRSYTSSGLFSTPQGHLPPPSPPTCNSFWCWASNAATGIVTVGTQFFSFVWNGAIATAQYLDDHLPSWFKQVGAILAQRLASTLQVIGNLLNVAWELFLAGLHKFVVSFLSVVVNPFLNAERSYVNGVLTGYNATIADVSDGGKDDGSVTASHALGLFSALAGQILILGLSLGVLSAVVLTVLADLSVGEGFLLSILLSILVTGALAAVAAGPGIVLLSITGVWAIDAFINHTFVQNEGTIEQLNWRALSESVVLASTFADAPLAYYLGDLVGESNSEELTWPAVAFCWDLVALVTAMITAGYDELPAASLAFVVSILGLAFTLKADKSALFGEDTGLRLLARVDVALSVAALAASTYELGTDF